MRRRRFNFTPSPVKERQDFSLWLKLVCLSVCLFVIIFAVCRRGGLGLSHVMDDEGRCGKMTRGGGKGGRGSMVPPGPPKFWIHRKGNRSNPPPSPHLIFGPSTFSDDSFNCKVPRQWHLQTAWTRKFPTEDMLRYAKIKSPIFFEHICENSIPFLSSCNSKRLQVFKISIGGYKHALCWNVS